MENEENWNTFARTGKVSDYLKYAGSSESQSNRGDGTADSSGRAATSGMREERGQREGTSEGYGAFGSFHW